VNTQLTTTVKAPASASLLELVEPVSLVEEIDRIHNMLARRAFEIFGEEGNLIGRDLDHWLKAESELLHSVPLTIEQSEREVIVEAEVPGFSASDIKVSLEPRKLTISGKRQLRKETQKGKKVYTEAGSDEILRIITLPVEVDVLNTVATLREGILQLKMPRTKVKASVVEIKAA